MSRKRNLLAVALLTAMHTPRPKFLGDDEPKVYLGEVDPDEQCCLRCGSRSLDTGWECTVCDYDSMPHYCPPTLRSKA